MPTQDDLSTDSLLKIYRHTKGVLASIERSLTSHGATKCRECQNFHQPTDPHVKDSPSVDLDASIFPEIQLKEGCRGKNKGVH